MTNIWMVFFFNMAAFLNCKF